MVRASLATGTGILIALLVTAGFAVAQSNPLALVTGEGGGQASGEASGAYYVDASGAVSQATEGHKEIADQARGAWHQSNAAYEEARGEAWQAVDETEPSMPQCDCSELVDELDQVSAVEAEHADKLEKQLAVENEYVDAGADLSAAGHVKAFFKDTFRGVKDAFGQVERLLKVDTSAQQDVKAQAEELVHTDDEIRGQVTDLVEQEQELPEVQPRVDGNFAADHASEVTSGVLADGAVSLP